MLKSRGLRYGVAVVISSAMLLYLFSLITLDTATELLSGARPQYIGLALICYLAANGFKALRFNYLIKDKNPSFIKMYYVNSKYNFYTAMIAGVGELSYPLMLKKMFGVRTGEGASSVVLTRIYDMLFLGMAFIFAVSSLLSGNMMKVALIVAAVLCVLLIVLAYISDLLAVFAAKVVDLLFARKGFRIAGKIVTTLNDLGSSLRQTKKISIHLRLFILSAPVWLLVFLVFFFLFQVFNIRMTLVETIFLGASVNLMGALPIKTIGGLGFLEAGLAGLLLLLGFEKYQAVSLGLMVRLISFSFMFLMMIFAFFAYKFIAKRDLSNTSVR